MAFEEALAAEGKRLSDAPRLVEDGAYYSYGHHHHSYLTRGIYADQVRRWMDLFPRDQILLIPARRCIGIRRLSSILPPSSPNYPIKS